MSQKKPGMMKPGGGNNKPAMTRIKTVWVTKPTAPFKEHYQVGQQIGEAGQFGKAFRCKRRKDNHIFAVKCISKARFYRLDRSAQRRQALLMAMQGEIDIMRRLKHKYIVNMESVYEDKHTLYIVMEECKGGELFDRIREKTRYKEMDAYLVIKQMCDALFYMHEYHRVVHCDLKPDNILFVDKSEKSDIKIIDFGMSKVLPRLKSLRELCGTPYYTAPEIIKGDYSHGADMWSVGVIMFVMLFGFPPFYVDPNKYYGQKEAQQIYSLIQKGFDPKVKKGYGPWFPKKMPVTESAKDLMAGLMQTDQSKRFTAKEALQHPWITNKGKEIEKNVNNNNVENNDQNNDQNKDNNNNNNNNNNVNVSKYDDNDNDNKSAEDLNVYKLANFAQGNKFKYAITALFQDQYQKMRPAHFANLKKLFKDLDTDNNGTIDYEEFKKGMMAAKGLNLKEEQIQKMFHGLDVNNVGQIAFDALLNAAVHDYLVASDQRLYQAFRELDNDEDGKIKTAQLKEQLSQINPYGNIDEIMKIIDSVDLDKDGTIDYEEFLRALHPNFDKAPQWFWEVKDDFIH